MYKFKLVPPGYIRVTTVPNNIGVYINIRVYVHILFTRITVCNVTVTITTAISITIE